MSNLSDLEITRLCAEAMGITDTHFIDTEYDGDFQQWPCLPNDVEYDPLHDHEQAVAALRALCEVVAKMRNNHGG